MKCTECLTEHELERCPACNHHDAVTRDKPITGPQLVDAGDRAIAYIRNFYAEFRGDRCRCDVDGCDAAPEAGSVSGAFCGGHWMSTHWLQNHTERYELHARKIQGKSQ